METNQQPQPDADSPSKSAHERSAATVLVVDDDSGVRRLYAHYLRRQGFEVIAVRTGREALNKAKKKPMIGALLDLVLPDGTGYTLCRKLRRLEQFRNTFVVMISGTHNLSEEEAFRAGADAIIKKPFSTSDLGRIVAKGIEGTRTGKLSKRAFQKMGATIR